MGMSAGAGGAIGGAFSFLGNMIGLGAQHRADKIQWQHEQEMYNKQKQDRIDFWNMENQYNTPVMQMQRLKDAGLNPNLVYGNGADAQGGTIQAPQASISDVSKNKSPFIQGMASSMGSIMGNIYDFKVKGAQANLLNQEALTQETTRQLQAVETGLKTIQTLREQSGLRYDKETLGTREALLLDQQQKLIADTVMSRTQADLNVNHSNLIKAQTRSTIDENVRNWDLQNLRKDELSAKISDLLQNVQVGKANVGLIHANTGLSQQNTMKSQIETALDNWEMDLQKQGLNRNSSAAQRLLMGVISTLFEQGISNR